MRRRCGLGASSVARPRPLRISLGVGFPPATGPGDGTAVRSALEVQDQDLALDLDPFTRGGSHEAHATGIHQHLIVPRSC